MSESREELQYRIMGKPRGQSRYQMVDYINSSKQRMLIRLRNLREWNERTNRYADIKVQRRVVKTEIGNWKDGIGTE